MCSRAWQLSHGQTSAVHGAEEKGEGRERETGQEEGRKEERERQGRKKKGRRYSLRTRCIVLQLHHFYSCIYINSELQMYTVNSITYKVLIEITSEKVWREDNIALKS